MKLNELKQLRENEDGFLKGEELKSFLENPKSGVKFLYASGQQYTIENDIVNALCDVEIRGIASESLPIKFGTCSGDFIITRTKLRNLKGCPEHVLGNFTLVENENLVSLEGCPGRVFGNLRINTCPLENLNHSTVPTGNFTLENMQSLTSLAGLAPDISSMTLVQCYWLENLKGLTNKIEFLNINGCGLKTLEGLPADAQLSNLILTTCNRLESLRHLCKKIDKMKVTTASGVITSLEGIADYLKQVSVLDFENANFNKGGLGLLNVQIEEFKVSQFTQRPLSIIKKYLNEPDKIFDCQQALIDAGFEECAKL